MPPDRSICCCCSCSSRRSCCCCWWRVSDICLTRTVSCLFSWDSCCLSAVSCSTCVPSVVNQPAGQSAQQVSTGGDVAGRVCHICRNVYAAQDSKDRRQPCHQPVPAACAPLCWGPPLAHRCYSRSKWTAVAAERARPAAAAPVHTDAAEAAETARSAAVVALQQPRHWRRTAASAERRISAAGWLLPLVIWMRLSRQSPALCVVCGGGGGQQQQFVARWLRDQQ